MQINPAVLSAAELFTDGAITDALLADVAAMQRLPLHVEPCRSIAELVEFAAAARASYANACRMVGDALRQCGRARRAAGPMAALALDGGRQRLARANRDRAAALRHLNAAERRLSAATPAAALRIAA